jgi:hypothetical protein
MRWSIPLSRYSSSRKRFFSADSSVQNILEFQKRKEKLTNFAFDGGLEKSPSEKLQVGLILTLLKSFDTNMMQELRFILHVS